MKGDCYCRSGTGMCRSYALKIEALRQRTSDNFKIELSLYSPKWREVEVDELKPGWMVRIRGTVCLTVKLEDKLSFIEYTTGLHRFSPGEFYKVEVHACSIALDVIKGD